MGQWWLAPAKLNLFLHVTGRRADGYHLLQSVFFFASVGDRMRFTPGPIDKLEICGPFAHSLNRAAGQNLIEKALTIARAQGSALPRGTITLDKRLPLASGIGGGSTDAATALRMLEADYGLPPWQDIAALAEIGADVPACYLRQTVLVEGIGEKLAPWPNVPHWFVVLVNCGKAVPTRDIFARITQFSNPRKFIPPSSAEGWLALASDTHNDLQPIAESLVPEIAESCVLLAAQPDCLLSRMSGSGATCFGLFASQAAAMRAKEAIAAIKPEWWVATGTVHVEEKPQALSEHVSEEG